ARNYGLTADPVGNALSDFGPGGGDWGAMNWEAPAVAEALAIIAATDDPAARAPQIAAAVKGIHEGLPMIPIVWYQHTVAVAAGLEGVVVDPLERTYGLSQVRWAE
ncbi:MAG: ABC transporter substrate-binding protein, partial [Pseudomonadota bacterium]